jgi:hypothetical protein
MNGSLHHGTKFLQKFWRKFTGISNEMDDGEGFIINDTDNEYDNNNVEDINISSESE